MQITISIILAVGKWWCSWVCSLVTITREEDSVAAQEEYSNSYKTSAQKVIVIEILSSRPGSD